MTPLPKSTSRAELLAEVTALFSLQPVGDDEFTMADLREMYPNLGKDKMYTIIKAATASGFLSPPEWRAGPTGKRVKAWGKVKIQPKRGKA